METLLKNDVPILARLAPIGSDWLRQMGAGSAARNLPSTRTGGQDDVSLNKLPQIRISSYHRNFILLLYVVNLRGRTPPFGDLSFFSVFDFGRGGFKKCSCFCVCFRELGHGFIDLG